MLREEVMSLITDICGIYPNFKYLGEQTIKAWLRVLGNYPSEKIQKAFDIYTKDNKYAPTPSDLIKHIPKDHFEGDQPTRILGQDQFGYFVREFNNGEERRFVVRDYGKGTYIDDEGYLWAMPGAV